MTTPFGKLCRALRICRDENLVTWSMATGMSQSLISQIETGSRNPNPAIIEHVVGILGEKCRAEVMRIAACRMHVRIDLGRVSGELRDAILRELSSVA